MNIVVLLDHYYPKFSAVSKCAYNLILELEKENEVKVISLDGIKKEKLELDLENHKIYRIVDEEWNAREVFLKNISKNEKKSWNKIKLVALRSKGYCEAIIKNSNVKRKIIESYKSKLKEINQLGKIDLIIPVCMPFEAVLAAVEYKEKNKDVILFPLLFDKFTFNEALHRVNFNKTIKMKQHLKLEEKMKKNSDKIFAMNQLKNNFDKIFGDDIDKFKFIEHPLITNLNHLNQKNYQENNQINFIYSGALYKNIRSPKYILEIFEKINLNYQLNFYSSGDCESLIEKFSQMTENKIRKQGFVSKEKIEEAYFESAFLISIGNKDCQSTPSKIFEYMSIGKPIIHFYSDNDDLALDILKKYPLALLINQDSSLMEKKLIKIYEFCKKNINEKCTYKEIFEVFPEAIPEKIKELILLEVKKIGAKKSE